MWTDILHGAGATLSYFGVSLVIVAVGYWLTDLITPGNLTKLICEDRSVSAAIVGGSSMLSTSLIMAVAIFTTHDDFGDGIVTTAVFGLLGVVLLALATLVIEIITPGEYRKHAVAEGFHPASLVFASSSFGMALLVAASIS